MRVATCRGSSVDGGSRCGEAEWVRGEGCVARAAVYTRDFLTTKRGIYWESTVMILFLAFIHANCIWLVAVVFSGPALSSHILSSISVLWRCIYSCVCL